MRFGSRNLHRQEPCLPWFHGNWKLSLLMLPEHRIQISDITSLFLIHFSFTGYSWKMLLGGVWSGHQGRNNLWVTILPLKASVGNTAKQHMFFHALKIKNCRAVFYSNVSKTNHFLWWKVLPPRRQIFRKKKNTGKWKQSMWHKSLLMRVKVRGCPLPRGYCLACAVVTTVRIQLCLRVTEQLLLLLHNSKSQFPHQEIERASKKISCMKLCTESSCDVLSTQSCLTVYREQALTLCPPPWGS